MANSDHPPDLSGMVPDQHKQASGDQSLKGAVDLSEPLANMVRQFLTEVAPFKPVAMLAIAFTVDGRLMMVANGQGGVVQILGLLQFGQMHVGGRFAAPQRPPPNVP